MDRAVTLAPDNLGVRIPRGAVLLTASRQMPPSPLTEEMLRKGISDYQRAFDLQKETLSSKSVHVRGELIFGLAEGLSRAGQIDQARDLFARLARELPDTPYAERAQIWGKEGKLPLDKTGCVGCHVPQQAVR